jgi:hypothetical protein
MRAAWAATSHAADASSQAPLHGTLRETSPDGHEGHRVERGWKEPCRSLERRLLLRQVFGFRQLGFCLGNKLALVIGSGLDARALRAALASTADLVSFGLRLGVLGLRLRECCLSPRHCTTLCSPLGLLRRVTAGAEGSQMR